MELCPDFGYFPAKILKLARILDLAHSLRFSGTARVPSDT
jgi:hypothetical protein